ncbi:MAG: hypothetical protein HY056_18425 [Proteobacteria bacterium]|nr:hypothetical protein [Pseudomonadota bacterium]
MSIWKSLFGGGAPAPSAEKSSEPIDYNGYVICATPFKSEGQFQTAGTIAKEFDGVRREHRFIRADRHPLYDDAVAFTLTKARQIVDQLGDRVFADDAARPR